jgi:hypothetical protein
MAKLKNCFMYTTICAATLLMGCANNAIGVDEEISEGTSVALFKITAGSNTPFSRIADSASLKISAPDMEDLYRALTIVDSAVIGTVTGIPAGKGRLFTVSVFDSLDSLQYLGTATADLPRGGTVNVPITLYRVGSSARVTGTIVETYATAFMTDSNTVAHYTFTKSLGDDDTLYDISLYGNHGKIYNSSWSTGLFGEALEFGGKGSPSYVEIPFSRSLDLDSQFTVEIIFKCRKNSTTRGYMISKFSFQEGGFWVGWDGAGVFSSFLSTPNITGVNRQTLKVDGTTSVIEDADTWYDSTWQYCAVVWKKPYLEVWVNGKLENTQAMVEMQSIKSSVPLRIAVDENPATIQYFWGKIDEIRISDVARTSAGIQSNQSRIIKQ